MAIAITVNGKPKKIEAEPDTPLLWVLRDHLKLTGTKYGCGMAQCGACTVHLDGEPIRSCITPIRQVEGREVDTIENLSNNTIGAVLQESWLTHDVIQCGYCQAGQLMSATALLTKKTDPSNEDIETSMAGNICRCGTYIRIRSAIKHAAGIIKEGGTQSD